MIPDYGDPLLNDVAAGHIAPEEAVLAAVLRRAWKDAQGQVGPVDGEPRGAVRIRLSAEARAWMQTEEYRAALMLLNLEAR